MSQNVAVLGVSKDSLEKLRKFAEHDHLTATPVLLDYVRNNMPLENTTIVSPDAGRIKVSDRKSTRLNSSH